MARRRCSSVRGRGPDRGAAARAALAALWLAALALAGCGSDDSGVEGPVTVYVSLPLTGKFAPDGNDAADGARLALEQAGGRAGDLEVRARYLDDAHGAVWDPVAVGNNARRAVQDSSTVAYIGELNSEPTRASAPITNDAGVVQISPGASGVDLTRPAEGYPESPERYRPSGSATFARVIPDDAEVLAAVAEGAASQGARSVAVELGSRPFGRASADEFEIHADEVGVQAVPGPDAGAQATLTADTFGFRLKSGTIELFSPALAPQNLPAKDFPERFQASFGRAPGPYAAYGYEAMRVALEAIEAAGGKDEFRSAVVDEVLDSEHADSILGVYSITADGDSTLCAIQPYELQAGPLLPRAAVCPRN